MDLFSVQWTVHICDNVPQRDGARLLRTLNTCDRTPQNEGGRKLKTLNSCDNARLSANDKIVNTFKSCVNAQHSKCGKHGVRWLVYIMYSQEQWIYTSTYIWFINIWFH